MVWPTILIYRITHQPFSVCKLSAACSHNFPFYALFRPTRFTCSTRSTHRASTPPKLPCHSRLEEVAPPNTWITQQNQANQNTVKLLVLAVLGYPWPGWQYIPIHSCYVVEKSAELCYTFNKDTHETSPGHHWFGYSLCSSPVALPLVPALYLQTCSTGGADHEAVLNAWSMLEVPQCVANAAHSGLRIGWSSNDLQLTQLMWLSPLWIALSVRFVNLVRWVILSLPNPWESCQNLTPTNSGKNEIQNKSTKTSNEAGI